MDGLPEGQKRVHPLTKNRRVAGLVLSLVTAPETAHHRDETLSRPDQKRQNVKTPKNVITLANWANLGSKIP